MHLYDIEDALEQSDHHGLQRAFRLLLDFPRSGPIGGVRVAGKLDDLLDQVTSGLQLDQTVLPLRVREAVERVAEVTFEPEASYSQAATVVFEFRAKWHALYRAAA